MTTYLITLITPAGERLQMTGLFANDWAAIDCALAHCPTAQRISTRRISTRRTL